MNEEVQKKKEFAETSKTIIQAIDLVKKTTKVGILSPLDIISSNILSYIHDNQLKGIDLTIYPSIFPLIIVDNAGKNDPITKSQELIDVIIKEPWLGGSFLFSTNPDILNKNYIDLHSLLQELKQYYSAYELLIKHEETIRSCDSEIIDSFKNIIDQMVENIMIQTSSKHEFYFDSTENSSNMLSKLNNGIINLELIRKLEAVLVDMSNRKLIAVQKKLFEMAFQ